MNKQPELIVGKWVLQPENFRPYELMAFKILINLPPIELSNRASSRMLKTITEYEAGGIWQGMYYAEQEKWDKSGDELEWCKCAIIELKNYPSREAMRDALEQWAKENSI